MKKYIFLALIVISTLLNCAEEHAIKSESSQLPSKLISLSELPIHPLCTPFPYGIERSDAFHRLYKEFKYKLHDSYYLNQATQIASLLLQHGVNIDQFYDKTTAMCVALQDLNLLAVRFFIELGANVNKICDTRWYTVPTRTVFNNMNLLNYKEGIEIINLLIDSGANINILILLTTNWLANKPESLNLLFKLLLNGADLTLTDVDGNGFFYYIQNPKVKNVANKFINFILEAEGVNEIKGAGNALLIAGYLGDANLVNALLRKGVWFRSQEDELYFNNLIADKPDINIKAMINKYKLDRDYVISTSTDLIPDLSKIVSEY